MNSHVHPLFAGILNAHAAVPAQVSMHDTVRAIVDGIKATRAMHTAPAVVAQPAAKPLKSAAQLQSELQIELAGFDPAYAYSDDHTFWREQLAKATRIGELRRLLAQGVEA